MYGFDSKYVVFFVRFDLFSCVADELAYCSFFCVVVEEYVLPDIFFREESVFCFCEFAE